MNVQICGRHMASRCCAGKTQITIEWFFPTKPAKELFSVHVDQCLMLFALDGTHKIHSVTKHVLQDLQGQATWLKAEKQARRQKTNLVAYPKIEANAGHRGRFFTARLKHMHGTALDTQVKPHRISLDFTALESTVFAVLRIVFCETSECFMTPEPLRSFRLMLDLMDPLLSSKASWIQNHWRRDKHLNRSFQPKHVQNVRPLNSKEFTFANMW